MGASRGTGNGMARIHSKDIVNHHHHPALLRYTFGMPSGRRTTEVGRLASPTTTGTLLVEYLRFNYNYKYGSTEVLDFAFIRAARYCVLYVSEIHKTSPQPCRGALR